MLHTLLRLWFLRRVAAAPSGSPRAAIAVQSLLGLLAWVVIDRWQRQPAPEWSSDGIPLLAWYVLAVLGLAGVLGWFAKPRPAFGARLALALGVLPLPFLLWSVGSYFLEGRAFWAAAAAVAAYAAVFLSRGLAALTAPEPAGPSRPLRVLLALVFLGVFIQASDRMNAIPDLWVPRDAASPAGDDDVADREAALFEQADRIDAALEPIGRDESPRPEGFFLGFAGVGDQKVFAQEIGLASRVLGARFDIGERRLSLVNDERDLDAAPIASVSGLRYALSGLAERMDVAKDVLFLAISSHGSEDPAVAVSNSQMPLSALTPLDLAEALHDSQIEWRVIVISACYAGGFIDALRDPKTIVITAAAADRTSFGCSSDSDLTYFGEAFYRDALPGATSLRAAFEAAKVAIAAREHREGVEASNPQAYFGPALEAKLAALEHGGPHYTVDARAPTRRW